MKANTHEMPGIAAFSDELRDGLRGPFSDNHKGAFLAGLPVVRRALSLVLWERFSIRRLITIR